MKVRLIKKQTIINYVNKKDNSKAYFDNWLNKLKYAEWESTNDIKGTFNTVDFLGRESKRVIFNIGGNNYRMICSYHFGRRNIHLFICWIGTHAEYDKLCNKNIQYTINKY